MKKSLKLLCMIGILTMCVFALTACGGGAEDSVTNEEGQIYCPLDGQVLDSADDHGDYVFMVSIDNGADSEPQSGIGKADLLIEIPVEGGINRYIAFFYHSTPDTIGPIRSARHYHYDVVKGYDAICVHCGGSPLAEEIAKSGEVKDINEMNTPNTFWRSSDRKAPHNLYTSYENLSKVAAEREYETVALEDCPSFAFMSSSEVDALTYGGVSELLIPYRFKQVLYKWDETEKRYQRYSASDPSIDALDGSSVLADNVVVIYVPNDLLGDGTARLEMDLSSGEGLLMQYGTVIKIAWTLNDGEGFSFTDPETNEELKLIPGKTIIQIADPQSEPAEYEEGAE